MGACMMTPSDLKALVRTVPDFPAAGVQFRDITTLISDGAGLKASVHHLAAHARGAGAQAIAGMEARGFIFGSAVAIELGIGFVPVRKPGKLPVETIGIEQAEDRSGEKACGEHQHDGRPTGPPRDPLRTDAENAHEGDDDRLFFHGLSRVAPDWCSSRRD